MRARIPVVMVLVACATMVATAQPGAAGSCQSWGAQPANVAGRDTLLAGVTVVSKCLSWAVGEFIINGIDAIGLIERWNGTAWKV